MQRFIKVYVNSYGGHEGVGVEPDYMLHDVSLGLLEIATLNNHGPVSTLYLHIYTHVLCIVFLFYLHAGIAQRCRSFLISIRAVTDAHKGLYC